MLYYYRACFEIYSVRAKDCTLPCNERSRSSEHYSVENSEGHIHTVFSSQCAQFPNPSSACEATTCRQKWIQVVNTGVFWKQSIHRLCFSQVIIKQNLVFTWN